MALIMRRVLLREISKHSLLRSSTRVMSSASTNFDELLVQLEEAEDTHRIKTLVNIALEYQSPNIHAAAFESALVASYKLKNWKEAIRLLNDMERRDLSPSAVAYSLTAQTCASCLKWSEAAAVVRKAWINQLNIDPKCVSSVLTACEKSEDRDGAAERAAICVEFIDNTPPELRTDHMVTTAIKCVSKSGSFSGGYELLKQLEVDHDRTSTSTILISSYTALMKYCVENKKPDKTLELFHEARSQGYHLSEWSYDFAMRAALMLDRASLALHLFLQLESSGVGPSSIVARRALIAIQKLGDTQHIPLLTPYLLDHARPDLTLASLSSLCRIYIANKDNESALRILEGYILSALPGWFNDEGVVMEADKVWCDEEWASDRASLVCDHALSILVELKDIQRLLALVKAMGSEMHPAVTDKLTMMCMQQKLKAADYFLVLQTCAEAGLPQTAKSHSFAIAQCRKEKNYQGIVKLFENLDGTLPLSLVAYNTVVDAYGKLGDYKNALKLLYEADGYGVTRDIVTFNSALGACAKAGKGNEARDLLRALKSTDLKPNSISYANTMQACAKEGRFVAVAEVFEEMKKSGVYPNLHCYNIILGGAATKGFSHKTTDILRSMERAKVTPDRLSCLAAIRAYAIGGDVSKAVNVVTKIMPKYDIEVDATLFGALLLSSLSTSPSNGIDIMALWLNKLKPGLNLDFKASSSPGFSNSSEWYQIVSILNRECKGKKAVRFLPETGAFINAVRMCENVEWRHGTGELDKGSLEGGITARKLVEVMQSEFNLPLNKVILHICLDALLKQLKNDKDIHDITKNEELKKMIFETTDEIMQLHDFDPKELNELLQKSKLEDVTEIARLTRKVSQMVSKNGFNK